MCKVPNCPDTHNTHFCRVCSSNDSDHFASQCAQGMNLFLSLPQKFYEDFQKNGFKKRSGSMQEGIYFYDNKNNAFKLLKHISNGQGGIVVEARVNKNDCQSSIRGPIGQITTNHTLFCLKSNRYRVIGLHLKDHNFNKPINLPRVKLTLSGDCELLKNYFVSSTTLENQ